MQLHPDLPLELIASGYPVSQQAKSNSLSRWKNDLENQWREQLPEMHWLLEGLLVVEIAILTEETLAPDLDNAAKPIIDSMVKCVFEDDCQIERLEVQRFERGRLIPLSGARPRFDEVVQMDRPVLYIYIDKFMVLES